MGLCKCPKRRVTNQFCFEHRVNVCENCMVTNHPKCIVQSYLQWLQDSDYNPICELCTKELADEDCIRLICYHVYHWACLDEYARQLPPTTAPAGYTCPSCRVGLFPAPNLVSPVADVLRQQLAGVNWARAGLGLPLLSEDKEQKPPSDKAKLTVDDVPSVTRADDVRSVANANNNQRQSTPKRTMVPNSDYQPTVSNDISNDNPHSIVHVEETTSAFSRTESFPTSAGHAPRRVFEALDEVKDTSFDHDENKYKRRSAIEWFFRWWRTASGPALRNKKPGPLYRRYLMAVILFLIGLFTLVMIFSWLGRIATENDPSFDVHLNPNVRNKDTVLIHDRNEDAK